MTDSDGYFSPRNHPQRIVMLSNQEPSKEQGEGTPLMSPSSPSPPYSSTSTSRIYGTSSAMGNNDEVPPYSPPFTQNFQPPPFCPWGSCMSGNGSKNERPVRYLAKWLFVRISFVVLACFLFRKAVSFRVSLHGGPSRPPPPPGGKGPRFGHCPPGGRAVEETRRFVFDSNPPSFTFEQVLSHQSSPFPPGHVNVVGNVFVTGVENADDIAVDFHFRLSDEPLKEKLSFDLSEKGVVFKTNTASSNGIYSCIEVAATISVPLSKPAFASFAVSSETLNIILDPSLDLAVDKLTLTAMSGDVQAGKAYGVDSNRTVIIVDSGDISGDFGLFELVQLETKSGSITTTITPQDSPTQQAEFRAATMSGNIRTEFPSNPSLLPNGRTYTSSLDTLSGSIGGQYLLGSHLSLTTLSGSLEALVTPTGSQYATLITDTKQGNTEVMFRGLLEAGAKGLDATHGTVSGCVKVELPRDWEGVVTGESLSGGVTISGKDVRIIEDERKWPVGRWVKAVKGAGEDGGRVQGTTVSGMVDINVGGPGGPGGHGGHGGRGGRGGWMGSLF